MVNIRTMGMLERAMCLDSLCILMVNLALKAGSSKHGNAMRAAVGSNCVEAKTLHKSEERRTCWHCVGYCEHVGILWMWVCVGHCALSVQD